MKSIQRSKINPKVGELYIAEPETYYLLIKVSPYIDPTKKEIKRYKMFGLSDSQIQHWTLDTDVFFEIFCPVKNSVALKDK